MKKILLPLLLALALVNPCWRETAERGVGDY